MRHYNAYISFSQVEDTVWKATGTATNLARLGQRMLWCHTPQVRHSGLLREFKALLSHIQDIKKKEIKEYVHNFIREINAGGEENSGGKVRDSNFRSFLLKFPSSPRE